MPTLGGTRVLGGVRIQGLEPAVVASASSPPAADGEEQHSKQHGDRQKVHGLYRQNDAWGLGFLFLIEHRLRIIFVVVVVVQAPALRVRVAIVVRRLALAAERGSGPLPPAPHRVLYARISPAPDGSGAHVQVLSSVVGETHVASLCPLPSDAQAVALLALRVQISAGEPHISKAL